MRVEDDDLAARGSASTRSSLRRATVQPARAREALHVVEPLRLARRDDQQRVGHRGADALERFEHRVLFALQRAGGDHDRAIGATRK